MLVLKVFVCAMNSTGFRARHSFHYMRAGAIFYTVISLVFPASAQFSKIIAWGQGASATLPTPPGNSLEHIAFCYQQGYDGLEIDLQISKDHVPVVTHGVYLNDVSTDA